MRSMFVVEGSICTFGGAKSNERKTTSDGRKQRATTEKREKKEKRTAGRDAWLRALLRSVTGEERRGEGVWMMEKQKNNNSAGAGAMKTKKKNAQQKVSKGAEELPQFTSLSTVFSYLLLYIMGHLRDTLRIVSGGKKAPKGYAPLTADWEDFYSRRFYSRIQDCWNRPICSAPGARVDVMDRDEEEHDSGNKTFTYVVPFDAIICEP